MTIVAWDGVELVADRLIAHNSMRTEGQKIERMPDGCLVGFAGDSAFSRDLFQWYREGKQPDKFPPTQRVNETAVDLLCITPERRILLYSRSPYPFEVRDSYAAIGSGREFAMAVLFLRHGAREAVRVAMALDVYCGVGIDILTF